MDEGHDVVLRERLWWHAGVVAAVTVLGWKYQYVSVHTYRPRTKQKKRKKRRRIVHSISVVVVVAVAGRVGSDLW